MVFYRGEEIKSQYSTLAARGVNSLTRAVTHFVADFGQTKKRSDPKNTNLDYYPDPGIFYDGSEIKEVTETI